MAQEAIVTIKYWDDIEKAAGRKVEADGTHLLKIDDLEVELDLTDTHYEQLLAVLQVYLRAGNTPIKKKKTASPSRQPPRKRFPKEFYIGLRAFADERNIRYIYDDKDPKAAFSDALIKQYQEYLTMEGEGNESVDAR
jgi:hypothetical protein